MVEVSVARSKSTFQIQLEYLPLRGLVAVLRIIPLVWSRWFFKTLLNIVLFFMPKRRALVRNNLALSFPELDTQSRRRIADESNDNFARGLSVFIHIPRLCRKGMDDIVETEGFHHIEEAFKKGKGMITFTAHYGCWEMMAIHVTRFYPLIAMVVRPLDNPRLDQWVTAIRSSGGGRVIPSRQIFKEGLSLLRKNGILGILIDQNFNRDGVFVDFFGRPASTTPVVSVLARRTGCAVLPMHNYWDGNKIRIVCEGPLPLSQNPDLNQALTEDTQQMTHIAEGWIRQDPGQWFWLHNRWKRQPQAGES